MARRIGGKGRREIRPGQIARRRAQRRERGSPSCDCHRQPVGPCLVGLTDAGDRAPELIVVLRVPDRDARRPPSPTFTSASSRASSTGSVRRWSAIVNGDLVVEARRRAQARRPVVGPVVPIAVCSAVRTVGVTTPSPPRRFHLVERRSVRRAVQRRRRRHPELVAAGQDERLAPGPSGRRGRSGSS